MLEMNVPSRVPASVLALLAADRPVCPLLAHAGDPAIDDQHRARQEELLAANEAILAQVDAERREMNADENRSIDDNSSEFDRLETEIARRERVLAQGAVMGAPRGRQTAPDAVPLTRRRAGRCSPRPHHSSRTHALAVAGGRLLEPWRGHAGRRRPDDARCSQEEPLRRVERRWRHTKHCLGIQSGTQLDVSGRMIAHRQQVAEVPLQRCVSIHGSAAVHAHQFIDRGGADVVHQCRLIECLRPPFIRDRLAGKSARLQLRPGCRHALPNHADNRQGSGQRPVQCRISGHWLPAMCRMPVAITSDKSFECPHRRTSGQCSGSNRDSTFSEGSPCDGLAGRSTKACADVKY